MTSGADQTTSEARGTPPAEEVESLWSLIEQGDFPAIWNWTLHQLTSSNFWMDLGLITGAIILAWILTGPLRRLLKPERFGFFQRVWKAINAQLDIAPFGLVLAPILWTVLLVANGTGLALPILRVFALITTLFVLIKLPRKVIRGGVGLRMAIGILVVAATLHIFGSLGTVTSLLDSWAVDLGEQRVSALDLIKGIFSLLILLWIAGLVSSVASERFQRSNDLAPSLQVLFAKATRIGLYTAAVLVTIGVMGISLTALAVFGGALGLGLGFGLQKVVSNIISGIILLLDKSIEPGDVIEIEDTYGWIHTLNMRYVSVITRDNKEHLIPNEDLITNQVINWSYSSELVRVRAPIGISYDSDIRLAMKLAEEAALRIERVVEERQPRCNLMGFGDSAVNLELRFWIEDPSNGVGQVRSLVLLEVWDAFHENNIQFPFPQRDLHIRGDEKLLERLAGKRENRSRSD